MQTHWNGPTWGMENRKAIEGKRDVWYQHYGWPGYEPAINNDSCYNDDRIICGGEKCDSTNEYCCHNMLMWGYTIQDLIPPYRNWLSDADKQNLWCRLIWQRGQTYLCFCVFSDHSQSYITRQVLSEKSPEQPMNKRATDDRQLALWTMSLPLNIITAAIKQCQILTAHSGLEGSRPRMCTRLQKAPTVARNRSKNISDCFSATCIRVSFCPNFLLYGHLYYISGKLYYYGQSSGKIGLDSGNSYVIRAKCKRLNFKLLQNFGHHWA